MAPSSAALGELHAMAMRIVMRGYREPLTLASVARALDASPRRLQRAYRQAGGAGFHEELTHARLNAAAELLAGQAIAVELVGRLVGYRQPAAFARAFRRRYGLAPAGYRAAARAARRGARGTAPLSSPPTGATTPGS